MRNADVITVRSPGAARGLGLPEAYYHSSWSDWFNYLFRLIPLLESSLFSPFFFGGGGGIAATSAPPAPPPAHEPATYYEPILNLPQVLNLFVLYLRPVARGGGARGGKAPPPMVSKCPK